jgi:hypothetical protein
MVSKKESKVVQSLSVGKRSSRIPHLLRWLGIGFLVFQPPGLVVCFGDVNHVAMETAYSNVHDTPYQAHVELRWDCSLVSMQHKDYPLAAVAINTAPEPLTPALEPSALFLRQLIDIPPSGVISHFVVVANSPVVSLRTTILRI